MKRIKKHTAKTAASCNILCFKFPVSFVTASVAIKDVIIVIKTMFDIRKIQENMIYESVKGTITQI